MTANSLAGSTLIDTIWSNPLSKPVNRAIRFAVLALLGTALIAITARIQVPFWPVPMTMQTFAILVVGMAYGWRLGGATVLLYLAEGAVGLPVFARGGGLAYFMGPTTGYLFGFVLAAMLVGYLAEKGWDRDVLRTLAANTLGTLVIFTGGFLWLAVFLMQAKGLDVAGGAYAALAAGVTPFIAGAVAKIALAAAILPLAWRLLGRRSVRH